MFNEIDLMSVMSIVFPIIFIGVFITSFLLIFSPKAREKMMARQIKSMKNMYENAKDDLIDLQTTMSSINTEARQNILDENEDIMRSNARRMANIDKEAIKIRAKAMRDAFSGNANSTNNIYCKHCGTSIDSDSSFCKVCGQKQ